MPYNEKAFIHSIETWEVVVPHHLELSRLYAVRHPEGDSSGIWIQVERLASWGVGRGTSHGTLRRAAL